MLGSNGKLRQQLCKSQYRKYKKHKKRIFPLCFKNLKLRNTNEARLFYMMFFMILNVFFMINDYINNITFCNRAKYYKMSSPVIGGSSSH
jgi:hypothetical protein